MYKSKSPVATGDFVFLPTGIILPPVEVGTLGIYWFAIAVDSSNQNVYVASPSGDIYKQTGGTGNFVALGQTARNWIGISVDSSNHDVYAVDAQNTGHIYKQTGGTGNFVALGQTKNIWFGISVDSSNHNVYASFFDSYGVDGDIYKYTQCESVIIPVTP